MKRALFTSVHFLVGVLCGCTSSGDLGPCPDPGCGPALGTIGAALCTGTQLDCNGVGTCTNNECSCQPGYRSAGPACLADLPQAAWYYAGEGPGAAYFGELGETPVPADFDGDGTVDLATFRTFMSMAYRGPAAVWRVRRSSNDAVVETSFGSAVNDFPAPGDYDGDGRADMAVVRAGVSHPSDTWFILRSSDNRLLTEHWGSFKVAWNGGWDPLSDVPVPADYDGDGRADIAVFRPHTGHWFIRKSSTGSLVEPVPQWGGAMDVPVPGDYDGDGVAEVGAFRPSDATWRIFGRPDVVFGSRTDTPAPADYDADGDTDVAVFRRSPHPTFGATANNLTNSHPGYDYSVSAFQDDNGAYRLFWCGSSPLGRLDAIWASSSSSPTSGFSPPVVVDDSGCSPSVIKVPASVNALCAPRPTYLMYLEGDNCQYSGNTCVRELPNKVIMKWSCDAVNWTRHGRVISPAPEYDSHPTGYGTGHPNAMLIGTTVYLFYYYSPIDYPSGAVHLATSPNGVSFSPRGMVGHTAATDVKLAPDLGVFVGVVTSENSGHLFFGKDLGNMPFPLLLGASSAAQSSLSVPHGAANRAQGLTLLTNPQGVIAGRSTFVYGGAWSTVGSRPNDGIGGSEIFATPLHLSVGDSRCVGSPWRRCQAGPCEGRQSRTCDGARWGPWGPCQTSCP